MGVFRNRITGTRSLLCCFLLAVSVRASEDAEAKDDKPLSFDEFYAPYTLQSLLSQLPNPFICNNTSSNFTVHGIWFDGTLNLTDLRIMGLNATKVVPLDNNYQLRNQKVLLLNCKVTFKELHFVVGYRFSFWSGSFPPLFASGNVRITFPNIIMKLHYLARFQDIDDVFINIRDLVLWFSLGNHVKFHIDGLDSELSDCVNDVVTDCLSYLANKVNRHVDKHYRKISATLEEYINERAGEVW